MIQGFREIWVTLPLERWREQDLLRKVNTHAATVYKAASASLGHPYPTDRFIRFLDIVGYTMDVTVAALHEIEFKLEETSPIEFWVRVCTRSAKSLPDYLLTSIHTEDAALGIIQGIGRNEAITYIRSHISKNQTHFKLAEHFPPTLRALFLNATRQILSRPSTLTRCHKPIAAILQNITKSERNHLLNTPLFRKLTQLACFNEEATSLLTQVQ